VPLGAKPRIIPGWYRCSFASRYSGGWSTRISEDAMFRELIDDYRNQAAQQLSDAAELVSGRWRIANQDGDQSISIASSKRNLAARLLGLSKAYEDLDGR
jgi:hypothetical protein